jgi:hypothetical protein
MSRVIFLTCIAGLRNGCIAGLRNGCIAGLRNGCIAFVMQVCKPIYENENENGIRERERERQMRAAASAFGPEKSTTDPKMAFDFSTQDTYNQTQWEAATILLRWMAPYHHLNRKTAGNASSAVVRLREISGNSAVMRAVCGTSAGVILVGLVSAGRSANSALENSRNFGVASSFVRTVAGTLTTSNLGIGRSTCSLNPSFT